MSFDVFIYFMIRFRMLNKVSNLNDKANSIFGHRGVVSDALLRAKARLESLKHDKKNI